MSLACAQTPLTQITNCPDREWPSYTTIMRQGYPDRQLRIQCVQIDGHVMWHTKLVPGAIDGNCHFWVGSLPPVDAICAIHPTNVVHKSIPKPQWEQVSHHFSPFGSKGKHNFDMSLHLLEMYCTPAQPGQF